MKTSNRLRALNLWLALGVWSLIPVEVALGQDQAGLDPVVTDVIEMLKAGVDEGVIAQWLESTDRRPTDIGRQGMIALTEAGASESLMTALLNGVGERDAVVEVAPTPTSTKPGRSESGESTQSQSSVGEGSVEAVIKLRAQQAFVDEDEPDAPRPQPWWVYLYLDGELVAWTKPSLKGEPVESRRLIPTGDRELRVVLQRYEQLRGGWLHESLSVPTLFAFEARPGSPIEVEVEMKRIWGLWRDRKDGGPLTYVIRQGVEVIAEHRGTGGNPDRWQPVCEDIEANFPEGQGVPKRFRDPMSRCVRWADLWTGAGQSTSRAEILGKLAADDFQPPVR